VTLELTDKEATAHLALLNRTMETIATRCLREFG
jgi:hypothetical protein